jgi:oxygen-independent coproporphyrinogen III oxidase
MNADSRVATLIKKYDVPVPRYTSYPTVPCWDIDRFDEWQWNDVVKRSFEESNDDKGISLYLHLPYCESLCTYCACNTRITKNHAVEEEYIKTLHSEWNLYMKIFGKRPVIRELHLGGGTPTFFSPENLHKLLDPILSDALIRESREFSFEGHPNNTTRKHLKVLFDLGFRRVSYGVQDLDPKVQKAIHRVQPFENLERVTSQSRETGYTSVGFDLVYGLPYQTLESVVNTVARVISLRPERVAFYSYAHVPWIKPGQRGYEDADLPSDVVKRSLYEEGRRLFREAGYVDIGMDHFALPFDNLAVAQSNGSLHRNFMGYTPNQTDLLVGLGASSISDAGYAYAQNLKKVEDYAMQINKGQLAVFKGHVQSSQDRMVQNCIRDIACKGTLASKPLSDVMDQTIFSSLRDMEKEGLVQLAETGLVVTELGRAFIRNICSVFDLRMRSRYPDFGNIFSKAV